MFVYHIAAWLLSHMVLLKHIYGKACIAFLMSFLDSLSVLWDFGVTLMTQFKEFLGLSIKFHIVLQLCRAIIHQFIEEAPSSRSQIGEVKRSDRELLKFPLFGASTVKTSGLQYRSMQQGNLINSQLNFSKFNFNHTGCCKSPIISEENTQPSPEGKSSSQHYLNGSKQDHFRESDDDEAISINHLNNHCIIPKNSIFPTEWNMMVSTGGKYNSSYNEEWDDSEEDSDTVYSSDDSINDESDQELNEVLWNSFFTADAYNPLNFTACLASNSTNKAMVYLTEQSLGEFENGKKNLIKIKLSMSQRHFRHFCTGENIKFCIWRKSARSIKYEGEKREVKKSVVKKLRFSPVVEVHKMVAWSFASREARRGQWQQMAQDRIRFLHRIQDTEQAIDYCLQSVHRKKIWERNSSQPELRNASSSMFNLENI